MIWARKTAGLTSRQAVRLLMKKIDGLDFEEELVRLLEAEKEQREDVILPGARARIYADIYGVRLGWLLQGDELSYTAGSEAIPDTATWKDVQKVVEIATRIAGRHRE